MVSERTEDYLEVLDTIIMEKGYAQVKDVARILALGQSSVSEMFQKLKKMGYINYEKYGAVTLTSKGRSIAKKTKKKHETLYDFLKIIGVKIIKMFQPPGYILFHIYKLNKFI
jgi:DtxR family Mn-dependent transcriptional regulator